MPVVLTTGTPVEAKVTRSTPFSGPFVRRETERRFLPVYFPVYSRRVSSLPGQIPSPHSLVSTKSCEPLRDANLRCRPTWFRTLNDPIQKIRQPSKPVFSRQERRDVICLVPVAFLPAFGGRFQRETKRFSVSRSRYKIYHVCRNGKVYPSTFFSSNRIYEHGRTRLCKCDSVVRHTYVRRLLRRGSAIIVKRSGVKAAWTITFTGVSRERG